MQEPNARWYPKFKNGELDLNPWYAVLLRRGNRWVQRLLITCNPLRRKRLKQELCELAASEELTHDQRERLGTLSTALGNGTLYHFTPEQQQRQRVLTRSILANLAQRKRESGKPFPREVRAVYDCDGKEVILCDTHADRLQTDGQHCDYVTDAAPLTPCAECEKEAHSHPLQSPPA